MKYSVYVLRSKKNGKHCTGFTRRSAEDKLQEHNHESSVWTRNNGPFDLLYVEKFSSRKEAVKREKYYKSAAGRRHLKKIIPR